MQDRLSDAIDLVSNTYMTYKGTINLNKIIDDNLYKNNFITIIVENFEYNPNLLAVISYENKYIGIFCFNDTFDVDFVEMIEL